MTTKIVFKKKKKGVAVTHFECACADINLCAYLVHACALGALLLQVNSMSVCLSRPAQLRLSAESKCSGVDERAP